MIFFVVGIASVLTKFVSSFKNQKKLGERPGQDRQRGERRVQAVEHEDRADREGVPGHFERARETGAREAGDGEKAETVRRQSAGDQCLARVRIKRERPFGFVIYFHQISNLTNSISSKYCYGNSEGRSEGSLSEDRSRRRATPRAPVRLIELRFSFLFQMFISEGNGLY